MTRRSWIGIHTDVTQKRQCVLASVGRGTVYAQRKPKSPDEADEVPKRLIDEEYTRHPFYGSREMVVYLRRCGHRVNRKRAQRLMRSMGLAGMAPGAQYQLGAPTAQGVPVSIAWRTGGARHPGLEYRHHLHPSGQWLCLFGGHHRLVLQAGAELANQQHHGGGVLRGLPGGCLARAWKARGIQQRVSATSFL